MFSREKVIKRKQKHIGNTLDEYAVKQLIARVTGKEEYAEAFVIRKIEQKNFGYDCYRLFDENGKIVIEANSGVSACTAFNEYLREVCKCCFGVINSNMNLPEVPPCVGTEIVNESKFLYRFGLNYVTFAYTFSYYKWEDYERLTDWLLLSGINLILNPVGFEIVWRDFLIEIGFTYDEAVANISDPAHYAWQWMGNLSEYGFNLPEWWFEDQKEIGNKITDKLKTFGADVIYPGFYGKVPLNIKEKYPLAKIFPQGDWTAAGERPPLLSCDDELFDKFARIFYKKSIEHFGVGNYYSGDPFHEGGIVDNIHLGTYATKMIEHMKAINPDSVWFFQGWSGNPKPECFDYVNEDDVLTLFLSGDRFYKKFEGYGKSPWMYGSLFSFGGNLRLMGNLNGTLIQAFDALSDNQMVGIGTETEDIEANEFMYEALAYTCVRSQKPTQDGFLTWYFESRYGYVNDNIKAAYKLLIDNIYTLYEERAFKSSKMSPFCAIPDLRTHKVGWYESSDPTPYDISVIQQAVKMMMAEYDVLKDNACYRFDLMHLCRQANADISWRFLRKIEKAYDEKDISGFEKYTKIFMKMFDIQDSLMSNSEKTMVGSWLKRAKDYGKTEREKRMFEHSVKDLITLWCGKKGYMRLRDYSAREWSGIIKNYYKLRWDAYLSMLLIYIDQPMSMEEIDWSEHSYIYSLSTEEYSTTASNTLREDVEKSMDMWQL